MNRWLVRLFMGLALGLVGLYFQYSLMQKKQQPAAVAAEGEGEASPADQAAPKGVPADLLKTIQAGQKSGGRRGRSRGDR